MVTELNLFYVTMFSAYHLHRCTFLNYTHIGRYMHGYMDTWKLQQALNLQPTNQQIYILMAFLSSQVQCCVYAVFSPFCGPLLRTLYHQIRYHVYDLSVGLKSDLTDYERCKLPMFNVLAWLYRVYCRLPQTTTPCWWRRSRLGVYTESIAASSANDFGWRKRVGAVW